MENPGSSAAEFFFGLLALTGVPRPLIGSDAPADAEPDRALTQSGLRGFVMGILVFRSIGTLVPLAVLVASYGSGRVMVIGAIALLLTALDLLVLALLRRSRAVTALSRLVWPGVVLGAAANLVCAATVPEGIDLAHHNVFWAYLAGCVMLVAVVHGPAVGVTVVVGSVSLQVLMARLGPGPDEVTAAGVIGRTLWLAVGLLMAAVGTALIQLTVRLAVAHGIGTGRVAERARLLRTMHDTVLQTLEAMSLVSDQDQSDPKQALAQLRAAARLEARQLRGALSGEGVAREPGLAQAVAALVDEACGDVRVRLVVSDLLGERQPTEARSTALRGALREALSNVRKHSGAGSAVVHLDAPGEGGVQIVIRDHGRGFDPGLTPAGFGVRESILARLTEVGGSATIEAWPGRGTRVRLWVPA